MNDGARPLDLSKRCPSYERTRAASWGGTGRARPAGPDETHGSEAPQGPGLGSGQQAEPPAVGGVPAVPDGGEADGSLPWRAGEARLAAPVIRTGIFGVRGTPDTSGY